MRHATRLRSLRALCTFSLAVSAIACGDMTGLSGLHLCLDYCGTTGGSGAVSGALYIIGMDPSSVDLSNALPTGGYRALLRVGDTATLHFMRGDLNPVQPIDTIRTVQWTVDDSSNVALDTLPGGGLRIVGKNVGHVGRVYANGYSGHYACAAPSLCYSVGSVEVIAR